MEGKVRLALIIVVIISIISIFSINVAFSSANKIIIGSDTIQGISQQNTIAVNALKTLATPQYTISNTIENIIYTQANEFILPNIDTVVTTQNYTFNVTDNQSVLSNVTLGSLQATNDTIIILATLPQTGFSVEVLQNLVVTTNKLNYNLYEIATITRQLENNGPAVTVTEEIYIVNSVDRPVASGVFTWNLPEFASVPLPNLNYNATSPGTNYRAFSYIYHTGSSVWAYSNYFNVNGGNTVVHGFIKDHNSNPISGVVVKLADCLGNDKFSSTTDSNGFFSITAPKDWYQLKTLMPWGDTILWLFNNEACNLYPGDDITINFPNIDTRITLSGVVQDEYGNQIQGATAKLTGCNDVDIISTSTSANGSFSLTTNWGNYKLKIVHNSITYTVIINNNQCNLYKPGSYQLSQPIKITTQVHLSGFVKDENNNPLQGLQVKFTDCNDNLIVSNNTLSDGSFSLTANSGSYKLKVVTSFATFLIIINNNECNFYSPGFFDLSSPIIIPMTTKIHGFFKDLNNNPINGLPVELYTCSDTFIKSNNTNSAGFFLITHNSGSYQLKVVIQGIRFKLVDQNGNSCFLFVGDVDIGTVNINPTIDCSIYNNQCLDNKRLFNCYFDQTIPACVCFFETCEFGCTPGQLTCNSGQQGTINVDVDNINDNYNPLPGAKVFLDSEFKGVTDSLGKKTFSGLFGYRNIEVYCPDNSFCYRENRYVDGTEYIYADCACTPLKGDLQVNVKNPNGYPVANVYIFLDGDYTNVRGLTNTLGYTLVEGVPFGQHRVDARYKVTNPAVAGEYQVTQTIIIDESFEVITLTANLSGLIGTNSTQNISTTNVTTQVVPLVAIAAGVVDIASITLSTEEFCRCVLSVKGNAFGGGLDACINAIKSCQGDTRICINNIWANTGATANKCSFEEIMLIGDIATPFIPAGLIGHGIVWVKKTVSNAEIIGPVVRSIGKVASNFWEYIKKIGDNIVQFFSRWSDDAGAFKSAANIGLDTTKWSDDAIEGLNKFLARPGGEKVAKRIAMEFSEEVTQKLFQNLQKLRSKGILGVGRLEDDIFLHGDNLDKARLLPDTDPEKFGKINGAIVNLKGHIHEAEVAAHPNYIDNVAEVSLPKTAIRPQIDILLKNGDIVDTKNINWGSLSGDAKDKTIKTIVRQTGGFDAYDKNAKIIFVFKELPSGIKSEIENALTTVLGSNIANKVILEVL